MSVHLHCDGPDCTKAERDPASVKSWWYVARQGEDVGLSCLLGWAELGASIEG